MKKVNLSKQKRKQLKNHCQISQVYGLKMIQCLLHTAWETSTTNIQTSRFTSSVRNHNRDQPSRGSPGAPLSSKIWRLCHMHLFVL